MIKINKLTAENYHDKEKSKQYMSVSLFKSFLKCEEQTIASLNGEWEEDNKEAFLAGSYVHKFFESKKAFQKFIDDNYEQLHTRTGSLYKKFQIADKMIETIKNDKVAMMSLEGEKEVIITGELFGLDWKIMIDNLDHKRKSFTDIKTTRDIQKTYWNNENKEHENFIIHWGYDIQLAVYAEVLRRHLKMDKHYIPHILAVSKEDPPDKELIYMPTEDIEPILDRIELDIPRVYEVWKGNVKPTRCGKCSYCRSSKKIEKAVYYLNVGFDE